MFEKVGIIVTNNEIVHTNYIYGDEMGGKDSIKKKVLSVMEVAVDGDYLCLVNDNFGQRLVDIDKRDVAFFLPLKKMDPFSIMKDAMKDLKDGKPEEFIKKMNMFEDAEVPSGSLEELIDILKKGGKMK